MGYSCNVACGRFRLNGLFVGNKALAATRGFQPLGLLLLLAGIAGEVVNLTVAAIVRDDVSHGGMIVSGAILTIGMSRTESDLR
jgi:hypothetical protein